MKIQIDKHANNLASRRARELPELYRRPARELWVISAYGDDVGLEPDAAGVAAPFSYHIEVDRTYPEDRVTRVVEDSGYMQEVLTTAEWEQRIQDIIEHEPEITTREAAAEALDSLRTIHEGVLRGSGGDMRVLEQLEAKWRALNEFVSFAVTP